MNKKQKKQFKNMRNLYFCFREDNKTLDYRVRGNIPEEMKKEVYDMEKEGFIVVKVLCNE